MRYTRPPPLFLCPPPGPIACPAPKPHYVIPGSHRLDPPYSWQHHAVPPWWRGQWPMPRMPWCFESETRAPGTGLITSMRQFTRPQGCMR